MSDKGVTIGCYLEELRKCPHSFEAAVYVTEAEGRVIPI